MDACDHALKIPVKNRSEGRILFQKWNATAEFLVAYNTKVLGYLVLYANNAVSQEANITMIAVRPEFQWVGVGKSLLLTEQSLAISHGMKSIVLEVDQENEKALGFYRNNGFL